MIKEYKTISEVTGPLMLVKGVEGVGYDELGEIELSNGQIRNCKVLEINGTDVLVQLFESSMGLNLKDSKVRFLGHSNQLNVSMDIWEESSTEWAVQSMAEQISFLKSSWISMVLP